MTKIKLCGLSRAVDIQAVNELQPDYIGFVFAPKSKRYVSPDQARELKRLLSSGIQAVGVFVNEGPEVVADLLNSGVIDLAQLHGSEDAAYIASLKKLTAKPIIQAFTIRTPEDIDLANRSPVDYVLLDSGAGSGTVFNWDLIQYMTRPYFLAGGLDQYNVAEAIRAIHPYAVDVSSGIETDGRKDQGKMAAFVAAVRKEEK